MNREEIMSELILVAQEIERANRFEEDISSLLLYYNGLKRKYNNCDIYDLCRYQYRY